MARGHVYRRRRADGTLGRWNAVIDETRSPGSKRKQVTRTFATERDAWNWLALKTTERSNSSIPGQVTVSEYLEEWLSSLTHCRASTRASCRSHVDKYLSPELGHLAVQEVKPSHVEELVSTLQGRGLAESTIRRVVATLSAAMRNALRDELISRNPVLGVRLPTESPRPLPMWTVDQARTFLSGLNGGELDTCLRLALVTGLRRGELLGLKWGDIDFESRTLHVRRSRVAVGGNVVEGPPKSSSGIRTVFLDAGTAGALRRLRMSQRHRLFVGAENESPVFANPYGAPWLPWWLSRSFDRKVKELGLPRIRFHDLRHASATLGLASGESLREISARLGHADISTTANLYTEVVPELARASTERRVRHLEQAQTSSSVRGSFELSG